MHASPVPPPEPLPDPVPEPGSEPLPGPLPADDPLTGPTPVAVRVGVDAGTDLTVRTEAGLATFSPQELKALRDEFQRFLAEYQFGLREVETKLGILREEFQLLHDYNPIEHVSSRVKTPDSLIDKVVRKGIDPTFEQIRKHITDIAGIRVTTSFTKDAYRLFDLLTAQDDITLRDVKDYIAEPKGNGYKSLHAIVEVPVFLSSGRVDVVVEVQFRTIAMDFWASLEHKIYYKYDGAVPDGLLAELRDAAATASELDARMERLHAEVHGPRPGRIVAL